MRVGILGAAGRMGRLLVEEARSAGHEVVGGTLNPATATPLPAAVPDGVNVLPLRELVAVADAVIDFTHPSTIRAHGDAVTSSRAVWVVGTTGLSREEEAILDAVAAHAPVMYAAHFGLGINLLAAFARQLGAVLPPEAYDVEILDMHHRQKVDAPSGSALVLGRAVAEGRGTALDAVIDSGRDGHTGARRTGAIGFAALRGGQVIGEHTLLFASDTEHITLSHRVMDRRVFAAGAVRAMVWAAKQPPALYGMEDFLALKR